MAEAAHDGRIAIEIDWTGEPTPVYANGAQVVHSAREFALVFTDYAAFVGRGSPQDEAARARVVASVRMTPDVFFQVAAALASNWNKFVENLVDPAAKSPRFTLVGADGVELEAAPQRQE